MNPKSQNIINKSELFIKKIIQKVNINVHLDKFLSSISHEEYKINIHKNILIIGKTGVGKSTLVNSFL